MMLRNPFLPRGVRGFSLMELAIVMGIMGVVMAAIWSAASVVIQRRHTDRAIVEVRETAENIRALFTGQHNTVYPTTVSAQVCAGLFAKSVLVPNNNASLSGAYNCTQWSPQNPWGGSFTLGFSPAANRPRGVTIGIAPATGDALPTSVCVELLDRLQATDSRTTAGGGMEFNNSLPYPASPPAYEPAQGGQPTNAYINVNGAWVEATAQSPRWVSQQASPGGKPGCRGVALFFEF